MKRWKIVLWTSSVLLFWGMAFAAGLDIPDNTWVRVADTPSDGLGREVPPGRGANWGYVTETGKFYRYGGYTVRYSNALDEFDPKTGDWRRLIASDENYPTNRPGGAVEALVTWDPQRKTLWIAGGLRRGSSGQLGIWRYDVTSGAFTPESMSVPRGGRMAFDYKRGLFVMSPPGGAAERNKTRVYSLANRKWEVKQTDPLPQETYSGRWPLVYDETSGSILLVESYAKSPSGKVEVWAFDTETFTWSILHDGTSDPAPRVHNREIFTIAADPVNGGILLHGGSDGKEDGRFGNKPRVWNDTWFFNVKDRQWSEIKTPGPTPLMGIAKDRRVRAITYRTAMVYDSDRKAMLLSDPDLGVWAFRYAPGKPAGEAAMGGDWTPTIGKAAREMPPLPGPTDIFRELPSDLNPRITALPDNTAVSLKCGGFRGSEIPWDYDWHHGVFVKYGGCTGGGLTPYWGGYGNDLSYYDPRTETFIVRRAGDVSGADRPGTGCTRSIIYDSHRKLFWFYGGASGSPGTPQAAEWAGQRGTWSYSFADDKFTLVEPEGESGSGPNGHACYMVYDPHHRIIVAPDEGKTWIFDTRKATWTLRETPGSPSAMMNYTRLAYVHSLKGTLRVAEVPTGRTSAERPAEARSKHKAAGNDKVFWKHKKGGEWSEWTQKTLLYDHAAGDWRDLKPKGRPTFRNSKYGLAYDIVNDVVLLVGGHIGWNGPSVADIWAYKVRENAWVKVEPQGDPIPYRENLRVVYDPRHNATLIGSAKGMRLAAYRYRRGKLPDGLMERILKGE